MAKNLKELSLLDIAPSSITKSKNIQAAIAGIDPELRLVSQATREALILFRLDELPEGIIDLLAWQYHVDFYEQGLSLEQKRELVRDSILWHRKKGTVWAVRKVLENLGLKCNIKEWFETGGKPYTFGLELVYPEDPTKTFIFMGADTIEKIKAAVNEAKPVRATLEYIVGVSPEEIIEPDKPDQPAPPEPIKHVCYYDVCNWDHAYIDEIPSHEINLDVLRGKVPSPFRVDWIIASQAVRFTGAVYDALNWDSTPKIPQAISAQEFLVTLQGAKLEPKVALSEFIWFAETSMVYDAVSWDGGTVIDARVHVEPSMGAWDGGSYDDSSEGEPHYEPVQHFETQGGGSVVDLTRWRDTVNTNGFGIEVTVPFGEDTERMYEQGYVISEGLVWKSALQHTWVTMGRWGNYPWTATQ